jgi:hypothetical protein
MMVMEIVINIQLIAFGGFCCYVIEDVYMKSFLINNRGLQSDHSNFCTVSL